MGLEEKRTDSVLLESVLLFSVLIDSGFENSRVLLSGILEFSF